ncbi:MAG: peptidoglycan-binding protein LysM [Candidatus Aminicenantes bacterium]|jgi:nucleoid-associated protein YgaU|nr:peptidoglycan-binding protein LysM [Candidatus Aminicenantes bacterium]
MGLLDFMKNVGRKVLGKGDDSKEIERLVNTELGDQVRNLNVIYKNGIVTLEGEADSQAAKEKAVLIAGNVYGVERVMDDAFRAPQEEEVEFYTIVSGDSLSKIAKRYYGNAMKYPLIFEANREVIKDADLIYPGQKIRIPKLKVD